MTLSKDYKEFGTLLLLVTNINLSCNFVTEKFP